MRTLHARGDGIVFFDSLPHNLLLNIVGYLDVHDVHALCMVSSVLMQYVSLT